MAVKVGATLVLEKSFAFPQAIFDRIAEEKVTGLPLVPTMAALILQMKDLQPGALPASALHHQHRRGAAAGAHRAAAGAVSRRRASISMYGLTECKRCTYLPPAELDRRPGSVGIAIPGTEAYVVDERRRARRRRASPASWSSAAPHVMKGYWENPEATDQALRPGPLPGEKVLYTGDLFRTDEEGFLYFVGRKDDIIKIARREGQPEGGRERPLRAARRPRGGRGRRPRPDPRPGDQGGRRARARRRPRPRRT